MPFSVTELTQIFQIIGHSMIILGVLLIGAIIAERILKRLARHHVASTDLDLIGKAAVVTHTIRPDRPGQIYYQNDDGEDYVAEAVSDQIIRRGEDVLIIANEAGQLRCLPRKPLPRKTRDKTKGDPA